MNARIANLDFELLPVGSDFALDTALEAVALPALTARTRFVYYSVEGADVRVRFGTDPDATTGHLLHEGAHGTWRRETAQKARLYLASGAKVFFSEMTR